MHSWPLDFNTYFFCWFNAKIVRVLNSNVVAKNNNCWFSSNIWSGFNRYFVAVPRFFLRKFMDFYIAMVENSLKNVAMDQWLKYQWWNISLKNDPFIFQPQIFLPCTLLLRRCSQGVRGCDTPGIFGLGIFRRGIFNVRNWCSLFFREG